MLTFALLRVAGGAEVPFDEAAVIDTAFNVANSVASADIDGDGDIDLLGVAVGLSRVAWFENLDGASTWTQHIVSSSFLGAWAVHGGDVDGDGDADVIAAARDADTVAWFENDGGSGLAWIEHVIDSSFDAPFAVSSGDIDGDGDLDIVGGAFLAGEIAWWENADSIGTIWNKRTVAAAFPSPRSVIAADLDGDGDLDLLAASESDDTVAWFENFNGVGTIWTRRDIDTAIDQPFDVHAADVDGDGDLDVLGAGFGAGEVILWINADGLGTVWFRRTIDTGLGAASSVVATDLDRDGDLDVVASVFSSAVATADVLWWENVDGLGAFWNPHPVELDLDTAISVAVADLDSDGDEDFFAAAPFLNRIAWWKNETIHRNAVHPLAADIDSAFDGRSLEAADFDGDGDLDLVGASFDRHLIVWWQNVTGAGTSWLRRTIDGAFGGAFSVAAADIDGDGDIDVAGAALLGNSISWWANNGLGTLWTERVVSTSFNAAVAVQAADIDGDGDLDLAAAAFDDDTIAWFENLDGAGTTWTLRIVDASVNGAFSVHAADLDNDGDLDLLGAARLDNEVAWWENLDGVGGAWTRHSLSTAFGLARSVYAADLDGDGDLDALAAAFGDDRIAWWENLGGSPLAWTERSIDSAFGSPTSVYAADLDLDGDFDVIGSGRGVNNDVAWWENLGGSGTTWLKHTVDDDFLGAAFARAADLDGDGDSDILASAFLDDSVTWWENRGGQFGLATAVTAPPLVAPGSTRDLLRVAAVHNGRAGDTDAELATMELLFEQSAGLPLTTAQANSIIEEIDIYLDDGSGLFEPAIDSIVTSTTLSLTAGVQRIVFADGDSDVRFALGAPRSYFVVARFTATAGSGPPSSFLLTHLTQTSSTAEDRDNDIALLPQFAPNVTTGPILFDGTPPTVSSLSVPGERTVTVVFSEEVVSGAIDPANYALSGSGRGSLALNPTSVLPLSGDTYRLTWSAGEMFAGGNITITVAAVLDIAGNAMGAPNSATVFGAGIATLPTVTSVLVAGPRSADLTFSEPMGGGAAAPGNYFLFSPGRGTLTANPDGVAFQGGTTYRLTWNAGEMLIGGDVGIRVGAAADPAGNPMGSPDFAIDPGGGVGAPPTLLSATVLTSSIIDLIFSEPMDASALSAMNYTLSGSGIGSLAPNPDAVDSITGSTFRLTWNSGEMLGGGDATVTAFAVADLAGNSIGSPNSATHLGGALGTPPTVLTVSARSGLQIDVAFSEPLAAGALLPTAYTLSGAGRGTLAPMPDSVALIGGTIYRLAWLSGEMLGGSDLTVTVASVADLVGNPIGLPDSATDLGGAIAVAPTVLTLAVPTTKTLQIAFSEPMGTGALLASNYTLTGSGRGTFLGNPDTVVLAGPANYRLTWVTGEMRIGGDVIINVAGVSDAAGNALGTPKGATAVGAGTGIRPELLTLDVLSTSSMEITFSEPMGLAARVLLAYTLSGSGLGTLAASPDSVFRTGLATYQLAWNSGDMLDGGDVTVTATGVPDLAGNSVGTANEATDLGGAIGTIPTVVEVAVQTTLAVDVTFSEPMDANAALAANYLISGSGRGSLAATPDQVQLLSGSTYRLSWNSGEMFNGGDVTVTVSPVADVAGNPLGQPNSATHFMGGVSAGAPTVTVEQAAAQADPTMAFPIVFDVVFSEAVTGFEAADIDMRGTAAGVSFAVSGSGAIYVITVTGVAGEGTLEPRVGAGSAVDSAGNFNAASTSLDNSVQYIEPLPAVVRSWRKYR